ncbi:arylesterase [Rhodophyticola sp. CCM32]|uniref:arylesterase n=1 Tax=Rhodophyticola sp. CCM32 TaxID=2916397 RepID=UPI00107FC0CB|nr:arylesterase [Rhodophyticola sp. CCM32]QBX99436.1 arylesterase [Rhodophyticola sp. CCM32]
MLRRLGSLRSLAYGVRGALGKVVLAGFFGLSAGPVTADEITIAALGDSLTQGYGLVQEDGFVPQLQAWLRVRGHEVTVINAGVSGDTTAGGLARVGWTLTPEVDAMIVALGGNDLLRGIAPEVSRANLDGILQAARAADVAVLLVGLQAPGNYGPDYQAAFNAMYPELAAEYDVRHAESFLAGLEAVAGEPGALGRYMQSDGLHPNAEGVALIVQALGPQVEALIAEARGV